MLTINFDRLELKKGDMVLDLGCGFGRHAFEVLRRGGQVVACDMALPELHEVRATYAAMAEVGDLKETAPAFTSVGDATRLPFQDKTFDRIIASEVLEHIFDDEEALRELFRVLKPQGILAITVPSYFPEKICWMLSDQYHAPAEVGGHVRIYKRRQLESKISDTGLVPIEFHRAHALHSPYWWLKCAVGTKNDQNRLVKAYLRFLTWDIVKQPALTRYAEKILQPLLGKSAIIYAQKTAAA
ncbi:MAG: class I SAM-dependent methyltransferase [Acidimicrobiales bacterium]|nr:class I SAM-dependent methyltransferase [Acidimicrobiales bacterium]